MRKELNGILIFVGIIWGMFLIDLLLPVKLADFGLVPRNVSGLMGIVAMPFIHGSFTHLINNTIPLVVLLILLFSSHPHPIRVIISLTVLSGLLLWIFGRSAVHVGASGFIYSLMAFQIVSGVLERRIVSIAIAILVGFLYGGTLIWGVLPFTGSQVSWDGHLLGALAGALFAWGTVKRRPGRSRSSGGKLLSLPGMPPAVLPQPSASRHEVSSQSPATPPSIHERHSGMSPM